MKNFRQINAILIGLLTLCSSVGIAAFEASAGSVDNAPSTKATDKPDEINGDRRSQFASMGPQQREQMMRERRARMESMSPDQRKQMMRERRGMMESMPPEQRKQMMLDRRATTGSRAPQ